MPAHILAAARARRLTCRHTQGMHRWLRLYSLENGAKIWMVVCYRGLVIRWRLHNRHAMPHCCARHTEPLLSKPAAALAQRRGPPGHHRLLPRWYRMQNGVCPCQRIWIPWGLFINVEPGAANALQTNANSYLQARPPFPLPRCCAGSPPPPPLPRPRPAPSRMLSPKSSIEVQSKDSGIAPCGWACAGL